MTYDFSATCTSTTAQDITINNFAGGDGTSYYANTVTYADAVAAAAGATTLVLLGTRTFTAQAVGTRYVYAYSASRSLVKNGGNSCATTTTTAAPTTTTTTTAAPTTTTTTAAPTTTTTTEPPVTYNFTAVCTGLTQTITIDTFAGGDGTNYYANTTTYNDAVAAAAGATTLVTGGTRTFTGQANGTRYVYVYSGTRSLVKNGGNSCTTTTTTTTAAPTTTTTTTTTTTLPPTTTTTTTTVAPTVTLTINAKRNGTAAIDPVYLSYNAGTGWVEIPTDVSRNSACLAYTSVTVNVGTIVSIIQRNINQAYCTAVASTVSCPTSGDFTGELCQNQVTVTSNSTIFISINTANTICPNP